jgi:hypothetical protein
LPFCRSVWDYGCQHATYNVHLVRDLTFLSEEQQQSSKPTPKVTQRCTRWKSPTGKHSIRRCCFKEKPLSHVS